MKRILGLYVTFIIISSISTLAQAAYFHLGDLIEVGDTKKIFEDPEHELTKNYIFGRTG
jgi:ABC-type phosphate transport system ATPase subunit